MHFRYKNLSRVGKHFRTMQSNRKGPLFASYNEIVQGLKELHWLIGQINNSYVMHSRSVGESQSPAQVSENVQWFGC